MCDGSAPAALCAGACVTVAACLWRVTESACKGRACKGRACKGRACKGRSAPPSQILGLQQAGFLGGWFVISLKHSKLSRRSKYGREPGFKWKPARIPLQMQATEAIANGTGVRWGRSD